MNLSTYQSTIAAFAVYPVADWKRYCCLGASGEAGEIANQVKKVIRDDGGSLTDERRAKLLPEAGDVLWYICRLASHIDFDLKFFSHDTIENDDLADATLELLRCCAALADEVTPAEIVDALNALGDIADFLGADLGTLAVTNVEKLLDRQDRGTLQGSGDNR